MRSDDLLTFVLHEVMKQCPSYTEEQARVLLPQLHRALGGERYYIPKEPPLLREEARDAVLRDIHLPPAEVKERHGISRRTYYRLIKKR
jgi:Mor family transcriptional regulator